MWQNVPNKIYLSNFLLCVYVPNMYISFQILLLEAGSEEPYISEVPAMAPTQLQSNIDWGYRTQAQHTACRSRPEGGCPWARGKVMGGSSTINYMIYTRGNPLDYDEWAHLGNPGWSYEEILPYFRKLEKNGDPEFAADRRNHGTDGYQSVERMPYQDENTIALLEAWKEVGLPETDVNTERQLGVMLLQTTTQNGNRASTNVAYIRPIRQERKNLFIQTESHVTRILIDPKTKKAFGVEYVKNGKVLYATSSKEVILSAGSLNSPKILMSSGVGPHEHLASFGIPIIKDLRVGFNLQDHATIDGVVFALTNKTTRDVSEFQNDLQYYLNTNRGPLSSTAALQTTVFVQTKYANDPRPDIQYSYDSVDVNNFYTDPILTMQTGIFPLAYYSGLMVRPILLGPKSRGVVQLNASDPIWGNPTIYANTFTEEIDLRTMVEGIKISLRQLDTHTMAHLGARLVTTPLPACDHYEFGTDEYWACISQEYTTTIYHPVGTCKMGPKTDPEAVLDHELRVYGIRRLRVIDGSMMPTIVRGNTNVPIIMIAEKGSDLIKFAWKEGHK